MMGERQMAQEALLCEFSLERHVPDDHWVRATLTLLGAPSRPRADIAQMERSRPNR